MSQLTENTIVIAACQKQFFLDDCDRFKDEYRMDVKQVFENDGICIFVTDCNGDLPWDIETYTKCNPWIYETRYGKKARRTLVDSRNSGLCLAAYIKRSGLVTPEQMKEIEEKIAYII